MKHTEDVSKAAGAPSALNVGLGLQVIKRKYKALPKPLRFVLTGIAQLIAIAAAIVLSPAIFAVAVIGMVVMSIGDAYESFK